LSAQPQFTAGITPAAGDPTPREIRRVFLGLMIVLGLGALDQSIVATALPRIVGDLGGITRLSWVVTAYVLASTSVMPLYGKLSDQYGRKPMLYAAIAIFLLGSALSGAAQSLIQLIVFRAVQGLGAGGLLPLSQTIIGDLVPPAERGSKQGAIVAVFAVCSILGPVLGGVITDLLSWHWIFFINLPIGAVALAVIARALRRPHPNQRRRIDYVGALLLTLSTTLFLLVLTLGGSEWPWASPQIASGAAATALLAVLFVLHVRRVQEPVLPLDLFDNRTFLIACIVLSFASMSILGATLFFPLFFQMVIGVSPAQSGFLTGPLMVGVVISSVVNGRVLRRSGRYKPAQIVGLAMAVAAFTVLAWGTGTAQSLGVIEPSIFALGLGLGLVMPNMTIAVQNALSTAHRGVGTATLAFFRSLGGLIGVTGAGAILAVQLHKAAILASTAGIEPSSWSPQAKTIALAVYRHAIATTFICGVCIMAVALVVILFLPELPLRTQVNHPPAHPE
jgi:EmrB/QacA subfamily drug resistance transporter